MIKLIDKGVYFKDGKLVRAKNVDQDARKGTLSYAILSKHNVSGNDQKLNINLSKSFVRHGFFIRGFVLGNVIIPLMSVSCFALCHFDTSTPIRFMKRNEMSSYFLPESFRFIDRVIFFQMLHNILS